MRLKRVHSPVVRAADCRSTGPWFKSGCALIAAHECERLYRASNIIANLNRIAEPRMISLLPASRFGSATYQNMQTMGMDVTCPAYPWDALTRIQILTTKAGDNTHMGLLSATNTDGTV